MSSEQKIFIIDEEKAYESVAKYIDRFCDHYIHDKDYTYCYQQNKALALRNSKHRTVELFSVDEDFVNSIEYISKCKFN